MKPVEAAKLANADYKTARKWKTAYNKDPDQNIPFKKRIVPLIDLKVN
jgi:hypothetical protein